MAEDKELNAAGDATSQAQQQEAAAAALDGKDKAAAGGVQNGPDNNEAAAAAAAKKENNLENGDGTSSSAESSSVKENGEKSSPASEEPPKDMRAVVLSGFGSIKSVKPSRKPEPSATGDGELLVKVKACGLNFQDLIARQGALDSPPKPPFIMGFECAGEVVQVGEKVTGFNVGDKVVALPDHKAWAEYVTVPATSVYPLPAGMSFNDAAAITMNYTVAYILLFELANLTPGKSILLHSAGGGVGQAIAQLAKTVKDTTVFGICSKSKHETLKSAGNIDHLLERGSDYSSTVRKETPEGVDIVFDCMYGEDCRKGYNLLKPLGKYVLYGLSNASESKSLSAARFWWQVDKVPPIKLYDENKTLIGFNFRHLLHQHGKHEYVRRIVNQVFTLWEEGKIKPVIDSTYALEDVAEGMQKMHEHKNVGKIILDLSLEPKPKPVTPAKVKSKDKKNAAANQEDKKAASPEAENGEKAKAPELTNGTSEDKSDKSDKSDSDSKEKESS